MASACSETSGPSLPACKIYARLAVLFGAREHERTTDFAGVKARRCA